MDLEKVITENQRISERVNYSPPECSVCYIEMTDGLTTTACGHVFHQHCIQQSIKATRAECPSCRASCAPHELTNLYLSIDKTPIQTLSEDKVLAEMSDMPSEAKISKLLELTKSLLEERKNLRQKLETSHKDMIKYSHAAEALQKQKDRLLQLNKGRTDKLEKYKQNEQVMVQKMASLPVYKKQLVDLRLKIMKLEKRNLPY